MFKLLFLLKSDSGTEVIPLAKEWRMIETPPKTNEDDGNTLQEYLPERKSRYSTF
jgi:hypothetical protein